MPPIPPRPRGRDMLTRLAEWVRSDHAWPDLSLRFERLWRDAELPALSLVAERFQRDVDWPRLDGMLDRVQADAAWSRFSGLLDRLHADVEFPSLSDLTDKLQLDIDLPEAGAALTPQHRQALRGVLLLGMVLHSGPVPPTKLTPPLTGGRTTIAETRGVPRQAFATAMVEAGYTVRRGGERFMRARPVPHRAVTKVPALDARSPRTYFAAAATSATPRFEPPSAVAGFLSHPAAPRPRASARRVGGPRAPPV